MKLTTYEYRRMQADRRNTHRAVSKLLAKQAQLYFGRYDGYKKGTRPDGRVPRGSAEFRYQLNRPKASRMSVIGVSPVIVRPLSSGRKLVSKVPSVWSPQISPEGSSSVPPNGKWETY